MVERRVLRFGSVEGGCGRKGVRAKSVRSKSKEWEQEWRSKRDRGSNRPDIDDQGEQWCARITPMKHTA